MNERFIFVALVISLTVHTSVLGVAYLWKIHDPHYKRLHRNRVEITYQPVHQKVDIREHPIRPAQKLDLSNDTNLLGQNGSVPVALAKEQQALPAQMMYERKPKLFDDLQLSSRISITPIQSEKINNPAYAAYNEMVRSRIEEKVYENYDRMEKGTVYLTFVLDANGDLKASKIISEKTNASEHLQEISLRSLRQAGPFPAFLKGMTLPEYTFNIEIQYKVREQ